MRSKSVPKRRSNDITLHAFQVQLFCLFDVEIRAICQLGQYYYDVFSLQFEHASLPSLSLIRHDSFLDLENAV